MSPTDVTLSMTAAPQSAIESTIAPNNVGGV
jgi:hypothetical protein